MNFVDGYFVTSAKLKELYSELSDFPPPHSVIYDNPEIPMSEGNSHDNSDRKKNSYGLEIANGANILVIKIIKA